MSKNIKEILKKNLNKLLETKGFENMEVAFGVKEKSDHLSKAEKGQFGSMESVEDWFNKTNEKDTTDLGKASVQPALNKVLNKDKKNADAYYKEVDKKMQAFQKTDESEPSQIGESDSGLEMRLKDCLKRCSKDEDQEGCEKALCNKIRKEMGEPVNEAFDPPKVDREEDQTSPEDVYSTEALGPGMLALRYDNRGTQIYDKFMDRMEEMNGDDLTYQKLRKYSEKYLKHKYEKPDEYQKPPKLREKEDQTKNKEKMVYMDVLEENIFKVKGNIKSKEQVIKLVDKLPSRLRVDETVFTITDGENSYKLMWEGSSDGEAVITNQKNKNLVNEDMEKMKHLWGFKSSNKNKTKKNITEGSEKIFYKMMDSVRNLNEAVAVDAKANKSTIKKLAKELPNDADLGAKCRQLIKKDGDCSQKLKDIAKDNSNDTDLGAACRKMCK